MQDQDKIEADNLDFIQGEGLPGEQVVPDHEQLPQMRNSFPSRYSSRYGAPMQEIVDMQPRLSENSLESQNVLKQTQQLKGGDFLSNRALTGGDLANKLAYDQDRSAFEAASDDDDIDEASGQDFYKFEK